MSQPEGSQYYENWKVDGLSTPPVPEESCDWNREMDLSALEDYNIHPDVDKLSMGLGWDKGVDVDGSAVMTTFSNTFHDLVWWNNLQSRCKSVKHSGDDRTGEGGGYDEVISVDLAKVPHEVSHILFSVCIYDAGRSFDSIRHAFVHLRHGKPKHQGKVLFRYALTSLQGNAMLIGILYRKGAYWSFRALGDQGTGNTVNELIQNPANLQCLSQVQVWPPKLKSVKARVIKGINLISKDFSLTRSTSDPFYILKFKKREQKSGVILKTLNPEWDEPLFDLGRVAESESKGLKVTVYDYDALSNPDFMGVLRVPGKVLFNCQEGESRFTFKLTERKGVTTLFRQNYGELELLISVHSIE